MEGVHTPPPPAESHQRNQAPETRKVKANPHDWPWVHSLEESNTVGGLPFLIPVPAFCWVALTQLSIMKKATLHEKLRPPYEEAFKMHSKPGTCV